MKNKCARIDFDRYELGIMINSLIELRNKQIENNKPTEPVDELLLKLYQVYDKESMFSKLFGRNVYECR